MNEKLKLEKTKEEIINVIAEIVGIKKEIYYSELDSVKEKLERKYGEAKQRFKSIGLGEELIIDLVAKIKKEAEKDLVGLEVIHGPGNSAILIWHGRPGPYDTGGDMYW